MIIHPEWTFISTMKCATHTLYELLGKKGQRYNNGYHPRPENRLSPLHFTACRNPYDRAVSIWASTCFHEGDRYNAIRHIRENGGDETKFEDFCRYCLTSHDWTWNPWLFRNQTNWHESTVIDEVIHVENLKDELESIVGEVESLPERNTSEHREWEHYMNPELIGIINEWAGQDFNLGYDKWSQ